MFDKTVDNFLLALTFVPDWFVTNKVIEKLDNVVFSNDYIVFGDLNSDLSLNSITIVNIQRDDNSFDDL